MSEPIYQILYCSRNHLRGTAEALQAEVEGILRSSRKNNAEAGVTGALFYNTSFFGQILEGSFPAVQGVFERLQLDPRQADLVILQSGFVPERDFAGWSMALAATPAGPTLPGTTADGEAADFKGTSLSGEKMITFLREVVMKQENWALPERPYAVRSASSPLSPSA